MQTTFYDGKVASIDERIAKSVHDYDNIVFQFSGGRDSQLAMEMVLEAVEDEGKNLVACFVDTGAEIPSVTAHVKYTCDRLGIPLEILKRRDIVDFIRKNGRFPHPIYKDCIHRVINDPINSFARKINAVVVGGHRAAQRNGKSTAKYEHMIDRKRLLMINPLYLLSESEITRRYIGMESWGGYSNGFCRTSCWCCPFQKQEHWEAMRKHEPDYWEMMRELASEIPVIYLDCRPNGGVAYRNFEGYWSKHGCEVKKGLYGKRKE